MKKVFERIISRIEPMITNKGFGGTIQQMYADAKLETVIDIINEEIKAYDNGWIPVSERLPNERDSVFAKYKGTDRWTDAMFEKASDIVNVTVVDEKGKGVTTNAHTVDGQWKCDLLKFSNSFRITHWQPLPQPHKEGE